MIDARGEYDPMRETEALVLSAAGYVRVSSDLRPRVVEAARLYRRERRARYLIRHLAIVVVFITWGVISTVDRMKVERASDWLSSSPDNASRISARSAGGIGEDWSLVDSFAELRDKLAASLRL
jgi:hypothetical protein